MLGSMRFEDDTRASRAGTPAPAPSSSLASSSFASSSLARNLSSGKGRGEGCARVGERGGARRLSFKGHLKKSDSPVSERAVFFIRARGSG